MSDERLFENPNASADAGVSSAESAGKDARASHEIFADDFPEDSQSDFPELPVDLEFEPLPIYPRTFWAPTLQQLVGAAERLQEKKIPGFTENTDWMMLVEQTRDRLLREQFEAFPLSGFTQRKNNKERILAVTHPADRLVQETVLPLLIERVETTALPCAPLKVSSNPATTSTKPVNQRARARLERAETDREP